MIFQQVNVQCDMSNVFDWHIKYKRPILYNLKNEVRYAVA